MPTCDHNIDSTRCTMCGADTYTDDLIEVMRATIEAQREKLAAATARTEAEQAVLDAMALVPEETLRNTCQQTEYGVDAARAELARRGVTP